MISRSYLFVPASRCDRISKALHSGAHTVVVDLEDAVPSHEKVNARSALLDWLDKGSAVVIRINGYGTPWFCGDLRLCSHPNVLAIMVPKAERSNELYAVSMAGAGQILPLVETAAGVANCQELAAVPRVRRLVFGTLDFQVDMGITGDGDELLYFRSQLVLASRLAGIEPPVDGVCPDIHNPEILAAQTLRSRRLGFGGKLCIHPAQVDVVNKTFRPTDVELAWAKRVVQAMASSGCAVVIVDGKMVDKPVILRAESILDSEIEASKKIVLDRPQHGQEVHSD